MPQTVAVDSGVDSGSGTACAPWIMGCDDGFEYYVKLVGRCQEQPPFREAEYVTGRLGQVLGAPVLDVAAVLVPAPIASLIASATARAITEQWAVGTKKTEITPETPATFPGLVSAQASEDVLRIVALHLWLAVGDHDSSGHNFFRRIPDDKLVTADHCTALAAALIGGGPQPVAAQDPGGLLTMQPWDDTVRNAVAAQVRAIARTELDALLSEFPDDPINPWLEPGKRPAVTDWIMARQIEVADVISS